MSTLERIDMPMSIMADDLRGVVDPYRVAAKFSELSNQTMKVNNALVELIEQVDENTRELEEIRNAANARRAR